MTLEHPPRDPGPGATRPPWLDRACVLVPAYDAAPTIASVIGEIASEIPELREAIIVIDDGSRDATAKIARGLGCAVVPSSTSPGTPRENRGKGVALRAGLSVAAARGMTVALTIDADGQHPGAEARRVLFAPHDERALVLGVRDLVHDGAPRANRFSNGVSNHFLSRFAGRPLRDTQCGLRRYPVARTLALEPRGRGYDFEAEVLLRAVWAGVEVAELPILVRYPADRTTHFRVARDPWRIVRTVVTTVGQHWFSRRRTDRAEDDR